MGRTYAHPGDDVGGGLTFGAIVSPPDAVAVTSITRRLGIERVIVTILDGESLLNDATAFVAYRMAVAAVVAGTFSFWEAGLRFVWTAAAGISLGLFVGWLIKHLRRLVGQAPVIENTISLLTPFAVFVPAERMGLASVLSVVAVGLYLGRKGPRNVSAETRLQAQAMWWRAALSPAQALGLHDRLHERATLQPWRVMFEFFARQAKQ